MVAEQSASASFDRCQTTMRFIDSSAREETDPVSAVGNPHEISVTGEKFDLCKTGWSSFVPIPEDVQPESVPKLLITGNIVSYAGDICAPTSLQNVQKTVEDPQVQYIDKSVDVPVVAQGQVHTFQTVRKEPQVQFLDRMVEQITETPAASLDEGTTEHTVEETDVPVQHVTEKIIEVMKHIPQECVQNDTEEQIVDVPVPQCRNETGEVIQIFPQDRISGRIVDQIVGRSPVHQIREQIGEVMKPIPTGAFAELHSGVSC